MNKKQELKDFPWKIHREKEKDVKITSSNLKLCVHKIREIQVGATEKFLRVHSRYEFQQQSFTTLF